MPLEGDSQQATDDGSATAPTESTAAGSLVPDERRRRVGETVTLRGEGLPRDETLSLVWHTVAGGWDLAEVNRILGVDFEPDTVSLPEVRTDGDGRFETAVTVPSDYGGPHDVTVETPGGESLARTEVTVLPTVELDRTQAPLGEVFTLSATGLGPASLANHYRVLWDTGTVGFVTGLANRGSATAEIRAVGPPGEHVLRVGPLHGRHSFLASDTGDGEAGRVAGEAQATWTVEVTAPRSRPGRDRSFVWSDDPPAETPIPVHYPALDADGDPSLTTDPQSGQTGTVVRISGRDFPAGEQVDLVWQKHSGRRMKGIPITPEPRDGVLPTVETDEAGAFDVDVTVPTALGGTRPITAEIDGEAVAITGFVVQPDVVDISPTAGPVGTEIEIELDGVGWTEFDNSLHFVYDNKPLGYVCGGAGRSSVERPGRAITVLRATGEPGLHFIDVYPNLFDVAADAMQFVNVPHLSHRANHPGRPLHSVHLAFEITE